MRFEPPLSRNERLRTRTVSTNSSCKAASRLMGPRLAPRCRPEKPRLLASGCGSRLLETSTGLRPLWEYRCCTLSLRGLDQGEGVLLPSRPAEVVQRARMRGLQLAQAQKYE